VWDYSFVFVFKKASFPRKQDTIVPDPIPINSPCASSNFISLAINTVSECPAIIGCTHTSQFCRQEPGEALRRDDLFDVFSD